MTDTRGTFRLHTVRQNVLNNEYVSLPSVWLPLNQGVGYQKMYGPAEYKFNFSTTTTTLANHVTTLSGKNYLGSTSNPTHAWFNGGDPGPVTTSSKITYATDTAADSPGTRLPTARSKTGAVAGQSHSYFLGGAVPWTGSAAAVSTATKLVYASDTISDVPSGALAATGNDWKSGTGGGANAYIFRGSGTIPTLVSNTQKITFANDTRASLPGSNMVQFNEGPSGTTVPEYGAGNIHSTTYCYYVGGSPGSNTHSSTVQKMAYASETWAVNPAKCSKPFRYQSGMNASSTQGSVAGGNISGGTNSSVDLITFATDVWAREPSMDLPSYPSGGQWNAYTGQGSTSIFDSMHSGTPGLPTSPERWVDGAEATNNNAYNGGGAGPSSGNARNSITKFDFSTDTAEDISPSSTLSSARYNVGAVSSPSAGYWMGGHNGSSAFSRVDKITYATDSVAYTPGANLSGTRYGSYCTGNTTKGYSGGANTSGDGVGSVMDRLTYATDTTVRLPGSNLTETRIRCGVAGSLTVGYWMGSAFERSTTDRMTYSTESVAVVPSAQLPTKRGAMGATASATDVYAAGGRQSPGDAKTSQILKLNLSSEAISVDASLASIRYGVSGTGNATKGYFIGGSVGPVYPNGARTSVNKLTYSTSTVDTTLTQPLVSWESGSMARRENSLPSQDPPTATPTASTFPSLNPALNVNAVFASGQSPSATVNTRSKFTFSNETMASMPAFSDKITVCGGASSTTRGYLSGGFGNTSQGDTQNKRWYNQYSNDTSALLPSRTSQNAGGMYSMNDETKLYSGGGGWSGGQHNTAESMPFANETNTGEPGMTLTSPKKYASGIGNKTIGFVCGGNEGNNNRTTIDKVVYSTGTMSTSPSNLTLSGASPYHATMAVGNTTTGFIFQSSPTNKLVFATETVSSAPNNNTATSWGNATSSATTGYCMNYPSGQYLIKYVFSTETTGTLPSMFSPNKSRGGAMSTAMFGGAYTSTPNLI